MPFGARRTILWPFGSEVTPVGRLLVAARRPHPSEFRRGSLRERRARYLAPVSFRYLAPYRGPNLRRIRTGGEDERAQAQSNKIEGHTSSVQRLWSHRTHLLV